ncbi:MAG TPA: hypothetical protein VFA39_15845 [Steroidobacteraceae bacterium]|nr:hypothetical protein [Steroidobacteraceae bacterium]
MLNRQACFEQAVSHIARQNCLALRYGFDVFGQETMMCGYRSTSASGRVLKCAVGALIPDDRYRKGVERCRASAIMAFLDPALGKAGPEDADFIDSLQRQLHDSQWHDGRGFSRERLIMQAHVFARDYGLDPSILANLPEPDPDTNPVQVASANPESTTVGDEHATA